MYNNVLKASDFYKVGIYIRLSEADLKNYESESESIINQRNLLMSYVEKNKFTFIDEYVDDGYTGTNFERPGFFKLLEDIENGKINTVITKDLSRLGRDYIKCGYYIENYFPLKSVRYISILDQIDTFQDCANNDIAPFKALFNDMSSKDTSKKIRSILKNKKEQGKFIGSKPCYGYLRDPFDKGHLIVDPIYSNVVKKIFYLADKGVKITDITSYLNSNNILSPSALKKSNCKIWTISSVNKILKNRMYTGDMVQNKQAKLSYKSKKKISLNDKFWIIVENTHEPLVSKEVFNRLQRGSKRTKKTFNEREKRMFENLLFCKECGNGLSISARNNYYSINCNKYTRDPRRRLCVSHFMPYEKLEHVLLNKVKETYENYLKEIDLDSLILGIDETKFQNDIDNNKIKELEYKLDNLYEDKYKGIITESMYLRISKDLNSQIEILKEEKTRNIDKTELKNSLKVLNRELLRIIIDKIIIDKNRNIEIFYNF